MKFFDDNWIGIIGPNSRTYRKVEDSKIVGEFRLYRIIKNIYWLSDCWGMGNLTKNFNKLFWRFYILKTERNYD